MPAEQKPRRRGWAKPLVAVLLALASLAGIGWGCWWIYPPSAPLTVGALIWLDLVVWGWLETRRPAPGPASTRRDSA